MINFSDIVKANIRFFYVILISIAAFMGIFYTANYKQNTYTATSMLSIEDNRATIGNGFVTPEYATSLIKKITNMIELKEFSEKVIDEIAKENEQLADKLTVDFINSNLRVDYVEKDTFFTISFNNLNEKEAILIIDKASYVAISEFERINPPNRSKALLEKVYYTETRLNAVDNNSQLVVGAVVGIFIAEALIIGFIILNPYVDKKQRLQSITGIEVLAELNKQKGDKNERR